MWCYARSPIWCRYTHYTSHSSTIGIVCVSLQPVSYRQFVALPATETTDWYKMQNLIRLLLAEICWAAELDKYLYFSAYNSHCSDQSGVSLFSLTDVWNFSFPRPIVTKASLVPADIIFLTRIINREGRARCGLKSQIASFINYDTHHSFPSRLTPWLCALKSNY